MTRLTDRAQTERRVLRESTMRQARLELRAALPNILTVSRIVAAVLLAGAALGEWNPGFPFILSLMAAGSDFLDGLVARRNRSVSPFGAVLDPIADKIFVVTALFLLTASGKIGGIALWAVLVIIWREFLIAGFRSEAARAGVATGVSALAKLKTACQYGAVVLLFGSQLPFYGAVLMEKAGLAALWIAAGLSVYTGVGYFGEWRRTWK